MAESVHISAEQKDGQKIRPIVTATQTKTHLESLLEELGLEKLYKEKLNLSTLLQIDEKAITDASAQSNTDLAWYFLKKLIMVNVTARNVQCESETRDTNSDVSSAITEITEYLDNLFEDSDSSEGRMNPLDIITALFLCSDGFVQQTIALKMSMCQFAVPLLLPNCDTNQCTLMVWAMRDIVKKYRPQSLSESKGFTEERIVLSEIPMISFVRLGECSLSKSEILNKLLSSSQQNQHAFLNRNMECGKSLRKISDGLVEITWCLPCGNKNLDIFSEPVAVANLRGDISKFEAEFSFLCHTSSAIFLFTEQLTNLENMLSGYKSKVKIFLVSNMENQNFNRDAFKKVVMELKLTKDSIIIKKGSMNDADFIMKLKESFKVVVENPSVKMTLEQMADVAHNMGILTDEDCPECQNAKHNADAITAEVHDTLKFKETQLPLQGQIWKVLTSLEKEEFRLQRAGSQNLETYKSSLQTRKKELREEQNSLKNSKAMTDFMKALSNASIERSYFLKWMQINLDNLSHHKLSGLRELYKEKFSKCQNKDEIKEIGKQLSNSSLGTEHFFREMGQIYEASVSLPESHPSHQQLQHLPRLCAQLLLDGFPLELVDGDASNIPLRWVSDVLAQLHELVSPNNKILVVTVLGVQSTGKSTLLNTMFGVQFAVSSGRCTRGASMLLIRISEDVKQTLNCDFLVIIDTEGLKSPELSQLDDSYEHDNELATLLVGLSDITIVNIAMENSAEMKDILQIVVHAFLRMKEVKKRPRCQFVHQNVSDVSAHEKNLRDRNLLLQQLNEVTAAVAKMERKQKNKRFTDVMAYNPDSGNWYIPGLWNGNPPMAPVNAGYSEAVYELKKNIIQILGTCDSSANNIMEFCEWIRSLWTAVQHENFIFSFRNSLVADAYMRLCTEFNKWEWDFKKAMYIYVATAETKIKNFGTVAEVQIFEMKELLTCLKTEACKEMSTWETALLDKLKQYFEQKEGHVYLVEGYKEEFANSVKSLKRELESSVLTQLTAAADIKQGQAELDRIKKTHTKEIENRVCALIENCRKQKAKMTDKDLDNEFDELWNKTVMELHCFEQKPLDVFSNVSYHLRMNIKDKGSHACQVLSQGDLSDCGLSIDKFIPEGLLTQGKQTACNPRKLEEHLLAVKKMANSIIDDCQQYVSDKLLKKNSYHDSYIQEILHMIDDCLERNEDLGTNTEFEVSLKQHICADAARKFQKMHEDFLSENDPYRCLNKNKEKFRADFKDLFYERDQCQKKAEEFTERCLRPAVEDFIKHSLGPDIIGEMLTCQEFSTRIIFQYSILLDLLEKDNFSEYFRYISSYEVYVKKWILDKIFQHFSDSSPIIQFEDQHLQSCISSINDAISKAKQAKSSTVKGFVENICRELGDKLVISRDALGAFMILNNANHEEFAYWLIKCVSEMGKSLQKKLNKITFQSKFHSLHVKPQNELFDRIIGCGKQCPFCKAPCEAGGRAHTEHWASLHRSQGLGSYRDYNSQKLVTDICTSLVTSDMCFSNHVTNKNWHPYKLYREIYPDWRIAPDISLQASDYWKYVFAKFNDQFASEYQAEPADIPEEWNSISKEKAKESAKESFNMK